MNGVTNGPVVNESLETSIEGVFACGNVLHVHDLVDFVSEEAETAGKNAAEYIKNGCREDDTEFASIPIVATEGVRYTVPRTIKPNRMNEKQKVRFRVANVYRSSYISVYLDNERIIHRRKQVMAPGEMEEIQLDREMLLQHADISQITVKIEEA